MPTKFTPSTCAFIAAILTPSAVVGVVVCVVLSLVAFVILSPLIPFLVYKSRKENKRLCTFPNPGASVEPFPES